MEKQKGFIGVIILTALVGSVLLLVFSVAIKATTVQQCLEAGYKEARVSWNFERYCVKRVNQTDVVLPLSKVKGADNEKEND